MPVCTIIVTRGSCFFFPYLYSILMSQVFLPVLIVVQIAISWELLMGSSEKLLVAFLIFVSRIIQWLKFSWSFLSSSFFYPILIKKKSKCSVFDLPVLIIYIVKVLDYFRKQRSKITWLTFSLCFTMSMGKSEKFLGVEGVKKLNILKLTHSLMFDVVIFNFYPSYFPPSHFMYIKNLIEFTKCSATWW